LVAVKPPVEKMLRLHQLAIVPDFMAVRAVAPLQAKTVIYR
jgi:hypothetical protein